MQITKENTIDMQLIADQAVLFLLQEFDEEGKGFEETKDLLKRKISGDNPSKDEWRENAFANAIDNFHYSNVEFIAKDIAYDYAYSNTYTYDAIYDGPDNYANANANANAYTYAYNTVVYIIGLLDGYIEPIAKLNSKVLRAINAGGRKGFSLNTTYDRASWEITLHSKGDELQKHFGTYIAASVIHRISTGKNADYFTSNKDAMVGIMEDVEKDRIFAMRSGSDAMQRRTKMTIKKKTYKKKFDLAYSIEDGVEDVSQDNLSRPMDLLKMMFSAVEHIEFCEAECKKAKDAYNLAFKESLTL